MNLSFTLIEFVAIRGAETKPIWVAGVRFADGPGMKVKSISFTFDRAKAARFQHSSAVEIALQFYSTPAKLVTPKGDVMEDETNKLQAEQWTRHQRAIANQKQINADFEAALAPVLKQLRGF